MLVGITGCSGTGASTVAAVWRRLGAEICSLDGVGHRFLARGRTLAELAGETGLGELEKMDGASARLFLRERAFTDTAVLKGINSVMHGRLRRWAFQAACSLNGLPGVHVLDGALIFELGIDALADYTVTVMDTVPRCVSRLCERDGISLEAARGRLNSQLSIAEKCRRSHFVINNGGSAHDLKQKAEEFYRDVIQKLEG